MVVSVKACSQGEYQCVNLETPTTPKQRKTTLSNVALMDFIFGFVEIPIKSQILTEPRYPHSDPKNEFLDP